MNKQPILSKIIIAMLDVGEAQGDVETALRELKIALRADKAIIGQSLEAAFSKLSCASANLFELEKLIVADPS